MSNADHGHGQATPGHAPSQQAHAHPGHAYPGHGDDVHVYEGSGIEEGNGPVPRWYLLVLAVLGVFFVVYLVKYLDGSQPSAAEWKSDR